MSGNKTNYDDPLDFDTSDPGLSKLLESMNTDHLPKRLRGAAFLVSKGQLRLMVSHAYLQGRADEAATNAKESRP